MTAWGGWGSAGFGEGGIKEGIVGEGVEGGGGDYTAREVMEAVSGCGRRTRHIGVGLATTKYMHALRYE